MANKKDYLCLKWGSLKEWNFHSKKGIKLLKEFGDIGMSASAMCQHNTDRQKDIICELIDEGNFDEVFLDWDGKYVSKEKAKKYIMEYERKKVE